MGRARRPSHSTFRALVQSNRFERAWTLLAHTYKAEVTTLDNVVPIRRAMIGVSMRVTPNAMGVEGVDLVFTMVSTSYRHTAVGM